MSGARMERRLAAILSADVAGYSRLMSVDEASTVATLEAYREQVGPLVVEHGGRLVDFTGDNFLAEFATATDAVGCAMAIQELARTRNATTPTEQRTEFRIGVHVGEVRAEGERLYGSGVNIAARLEGTAETAGICISAAVLDQVRRQPGLAFEDLGPQHFKNIPDPVHTYRLRASDAGRPTADAAAGDEPSIAVLPFVNMSPDPDQEYFADGMAEEILGALTQIEGLRVIARTSSFSFKGSHADIATIGRALDVATILEGSVRKSGDRVRISAQLIDVAGGHHLWSEVYDRSLDDVFEIQDEISRTLVRTIKPRLLRERAAPLVVQSTASREAYELYLRAAERIARLDRRDTRTAIGMLEDATTIDPDYADAWARLAVACSQLAFTGDPDERWPELAEKAVRRAFELDPDNPDAHFAHARILWSPRHGFQHHAAMCSLNACLQLQPGAQQARMWRSAVFGHVGLLEEAREGLLDALSGMPDDANTLSMFGQVAHFQGRLEEADEYYQRACRQDPTLWLHHWLIPPLRLYMDDLAGAEDALGKARLTLGDDPVLDSCDALLWAKRGERERADAAIARSDRRRSVAHDHHRVHYRAAALATLGRRAEAVAQLRLAADTGLPNHPLFRDDPHFAGLAGDPDWTALLANLAQRCEQFRSEFASSGSA